MRRRWWPLWLAAAWMAVEVLAQRLALRRHAVGPALVRHGRHPGGRGPALRRRERRSASCSRCSAPCWPGWWWRPAATTRLVAGAVAGRAVVAVRAARRLRCPVAPYSRRGARSRSPPSRATSPGNGDDILYDFRQVTQNHVDATTRLAARRRRGDQVPRPTSWSGPRTPRRSTRSATPRPTRDHRGRQRRDRRPDPGRRDRGRRSRAGRAQPGHRLGPGHRGGGALHQAAPGAVRRVHPLAREFFTRQLRPARRDRPRHAERHPHGAARRSPGSRSANAICFDVAYDDGDPRPGRATAPSCSSSRPATRPSSTPTRSSSSSRSPGCGRSRPVAAVVVASTNGVTGVIAPGRRGRSSGRAPHPGGARRTPVGLDHAASPRRCGSGPWSGGRSSPVVG